MLDKEKIKKKLHINAMKKIAKSEDIESFKLIYDYFGPRLKSFLISSGSEETSAEEIIQETMAIIWTKADYYNPKLASPSTWIYTIARNKKIDFLRKTRKAVFENIDTAILPPVEPVLDESIDHNQSFNLIDSYLNSLPEEQMLLLKMNFIEEKSHGEIAKITGISLGTVKSRIRLAMEKIRMRIKSEGISFDLNNKNKSKNFK